MDLCEIGNSGFGQTAQHPDDRTSCKHRVSTISARNSRLLGCSVCGEWSFEPGEYSRFGRTLYLATGGASLPFPRLTKVFYYGREP
jgi:hypothetical protein